MCERKYLPNSPSCFVCGVNNPAGLQARFYVENEVVKTPLQLKEHHCGYPNVSHGGIVAAALDEAMAWAASRALRRFCVTGELKVRYLKNVPTDIPLTTRAEIVRTHRRIAFTKAAIVDDAGIEYATAEGKFLPLSPEETLRVDDALLYTGDEERLFDELRKEVQQSN